MYTQNMSLFWTAKILTNKVSISFLTNTMNHRMFFKSKKKDVKWAMASVLAVLNEDDSWNEHLKDLHEQYNNTP